MFIEAIRTIEPGEELTYDYQIQREADDPANIDEIFACRCGCRRCRGTHAVAGAQCGAAARRAARRTAQPSGA